jgi:hypothetical protein
MVNEKRQATSVRPNTTCLAFFGEYGENEPQNYGIYFSSNPFSDIF